MAVTQAQLGAKGFSQHVCVERATSGAWIEVVDYRFDGTELEGCAEESLLRWRVTPAYSKSSWQSASQMQFKEIGNVLFLPGRIPFRARPSNALQSSRNLVCHFHPELEQQILDRGMPHTTNAAEQCREIRCARTDMTLHRLWQEMMQPGFASELLLEGLTATLVVDIVRYFRRADSVGRHVSRPTGTLSNADLQRIADFIHDARGGCPTSSQLAAVCNMSPSSFRNRFKLTTGRSIHSYVEEIRSSRAKELLLNSAMLIKEIAYELGFTHQATFASSFKRLVGMSPTEYRGAHLD